MSVRTHIWTFHYVCEETSELSLSYCCLLPFSFNSKSSNFYLLVLEMTLNWIIRCIYFTLILNYQTTVIKTKKSDIKLHLFSSLGTTISFSGTILNRNSFFYLLFESRMEKWNGVIHSVVLSDKDLPFYSWSQQLGKPFWIF